jgi:DNA-binding CsgD family transcriptional regulator
VKTAEEADSNTQKQKNFLGPLRDLLLQQVSQKFFQEILDFTLHVLPHAQGGSVMMLLDKRYHYVAVKGYDLNGLKQVSLSLEEAMVLAEPFRPAIILNDFQGYNKLLLDDERQELLETFGRVSEIKETLFVPMCHQDQIVAMLFLDNFETSNAFTQKEITLAEEIGVYLGLAAKLWSYERQLSVYEQNAISTSVEQIQTKSSENDVVELCPREKEVLLHLVEGLSNKEIAKELNLSEFTVRDYAQNLYQKIGVHSRMKAREWARNNKHSWE